MDREGTVVYVVCWVMPFGSLIAATLLTVATLLIVATSSECPTTYPETTSTPVDNKGTAMFDEQCLFALLALLGLLASLGFPSNDSADCSDFAFAAKNIYM